MCTVPAGGGTRLPSALTQEEEYEYNPNLMGSQPSSVSYACLPQTQVRISERQCFKRMRQTCTCATRYAVHTEHTHMYDTHIIHTESTRMVSGEGHCGNH